jgi:hypothetical protein
LVTLLDLAIPDSFDNTHHFYHKLCCFTDDIRLTYVELGLIIGVFLPIQQL